MDYNCNRGVIERGDVWVNVSKYNFIYSNVIENSEQVVIYNSRTGALAVLEPENYRQLRDFEESKKPITDKEFENQLRKCGYIVASGFDELRQVKHDMLRSRYNSAFMALTIAPTMACNFRCVYCFEKGQYHNQAMTEQTVQEIVDFIDSKANQLEQLSITWYGGEPLLAMSQVETISKQVLTICNEHNIDYKSTVITNGYLLNPHIATRLKDCGVDDIQITIDGPKEIHDQRRPLANGKGTFDVIMNNLLVVRGILPIMVRINTDYENWEQLNEIVEFFRQNDLMNDIMVYLGLVVPSNGQYEGSKCLSDDTYSKFNLRFMQENDIPLTYIYPAPKGNYCTADQTNSWVIDPHGDLYKCWSDIGIVERRTSTLGEDNTNVNSTLLNDYMLYDPTEDERCKDCKYLPLCMGGCPHNRMENLKICAQYRYNLDEYLAECTKILLESQQRSLE